MNVLPHIWLLWPTLQPWWRWRRCGQRCQSLRVKQDGVGKKEHPAVCVDVPWPLPQLLGAGDVRSKSSLTCHPDSGCCHLIIVVTGKRLRLTLSMPFHVSECSASQHPGSLNWFKCLFQKSPPPTQRTGSQWTTDQASNSFVPSNRANSELPKEHWLRVRLLKPDALSQCNIATCLIEWPSALAF